MTWGQVGWLVIAAIAVVATIGLHPATRMGTRFLDRFGPPREDTPAGIATTS